MNLSTPRKILVVAPQPFYSDRGTPIATRYLLQALHELGYEADVLTYRLGRPLHVPGVRVIRMRDPLRLRSVPIGFSLRKCWLDLFLFSSLRRCLRENQYVCVSALEEAVFVVALVAPQFGVPVVYDMQSSLAEQMTRMAPFRNQLARGFFERLENWLFDRVDLIMTSAGLAERVRRSDPRAPVREWRYPGTMEPASPAEIEQLRTDLDLDGAGSIILYSGSFKDYQGLPQLLGAMPAVLDRAPRAVLLLVGAENGAEDEEVRRLSRRIPVHAVRILDRQPYELMSQYLGLADVVVSPRLYGENLPIKILDYLAAGRAIVATSIPAHRTVLDEGRAVLVEPKPEALAAGLTSLLLNEPRRAELANNARRYAEQHLGWLGFVQSVGEIFGELAGDDRTA